MAIGACWVGREILSKAFPAGIAEFPRRAGNPGGGIVTISIFAVEPKPPAGACGVKLLASWLQRQVNFDNGTVFSLPYNNSARIGFIFFDSVRKLCALSIVAPWVAPDLKGPLYGFMTNETVRTPLTEHLEKDNFCETRAIFNSYGFYIVLKPVSVKEMNFLRNSNEIQKNKNK